MAQIQKESKILKVLIYLFVLVLFIWIGFPFYWMFLSSIKSPLELSLAPPSYWPKNPVFANYIDVWTAFPFLREMWNSFYITLLTIIVSLALTSTTSYALSRFNFRGKNFVIGFFLFHL